MSSRGSGAGAGKGRAGGSKGAAGGSKRRVGGRKGAAGGRKGRGGGSKGRAGGSKVAAGGSKGGRGSGERGKKAAISVVPGAKHDYTPEKRDRCREEGENHLIYPVLNGDRWGLCIDDKKYKPLFTFLRQTDWASKDSNTIRVAFVGSSGNGKSTLASALTNGLVQPLLAKDFEKDRVQTSTTSGIVVHSCVWPEPQQENAEAEAEEPAPAPAQVTPRKAWIVDCEGAFGRIPRTNMVEAAKASLTGSRFAKYESIANVNIPMLAYSMSQVVVYVMRGSFQNVRDLKEIKKFAELCRASMLVPRPYLILVRNRCPNNELPDVGKEDMAEAYFKEKPELHTQLKMCFCGISVYCIPEIPRARKSRGGQELKPDPLEVEDYKALLEELRKQVAVACNVVRSAQAKMSSLNWLQFVKDITEQLDNITLTGKGMLSSDDALMKVLGGTDTWLAQPLLGEKRLNELLFFNVVPAAKDFENAKFARAYEIYIDHCFQYVAACTAIQVAEGDDDGQDDMLRWLKVWLCQTSPCWHRLNDSERRCGRYKCMHSTDKQHHGRFWARTWYTCWIYGTWVGVQQPGEHMYVPLQWDCEGGTTATGNAADYIAHVCTKIRFSAAVMRYRTANDFMGDKALFGVLLRFPALPRTKK